MSAHVESAIENARIKKDKRGLMPLAEARALVKATEVYRKGDGEMLGGTFVLESDRVWAALLSLKDAAEFVREATRIQWAFHVRGFDNLGLVERYGDGILPWLRSRIDKRGTLHNVPWCVLPCLLALDTREALELALEARALDAQLPDFTQPGYFAAERHDDAEGEAPNPDPLAVARKWIDAHPGRMSWLKELASGGNAKAAALIVDRAPPPIPEAARAVLDAAESVDEPEGPVWGIAELDNAAESYDLPLWDNANYATGAMRITGFASRHGDVLFVQSINYQPRASVPVERDVTAYGPGAKKRSLNKQLVEDDGVELDDHTRVISANNDIVVWGEFDEKGKPLKESRGDRYIPSPMPADYYIASLDGEDVHYDPHFPESFATDRLHDLYRLTPAEAVLVDLCRRYPDKVFLPSARLAKYAPDGAIPLFQFDDFEWVAAGVKASTSIDLVTIVEALRTRRRITALPGSPNSRPEAWMLDSSDVRFFAGGNAWSPGDEPIAKPRRTDGPGNTPYQNLLFERGWPHGVLLFHAEPTTDGLEETLAYLVANQGNATPYWDRTKATAWVRALGTATTLSMKDKGVKRAMKELRPVHPGEARVLLENLPNLPAWAARQMILILEALIGGDETILALAKVLKGDTPALAAAALASAFILRRIPEKPQRVKGDPQRAKIRDRAQVCAVLAKAKVKGETKRMLAVALGEADMLKELEDGPFDSFLVTLGGDAYLKKMTPRLIKEATAWNGYELSVLRSPVAAQILANLKAARADLAEALKSVGA